MLLGVDVGGTFTDAVLAWDGGLVTAKAPSTPEDQSIGVIAAVTAALDRAQRPARDVESFSHGMTVATNALLEGRSARTALIATEGFEDLVELGRQARADLYRLCAAHPAPLAPPERRFGAPERMTPDGPLRALGPSDAEALAARVSREAAPEAVAVVLLHAYRHPEHELAIGAALERVLPGAHVSLSHQVVGTFREYERAATTEIDAGLSPLLGRYLSRLAERSEQTGLPHPEIMQSNGGLIDARAAASHASWTVLSGPAAGAAGAAFAARVAGAPSVLCFDMGGTSCDVCVVEDGRVRETAGREVGGRPLALPMLDVHTVGAGGGSIAWRDAGGALRVGPRSAGAQPGPACYGRGGTEPTVTDANLVLGLLPTGGALAGGVTLDAEAARRAVGNLGGALGLDLVAAARGIVRVANAEMVRALRVMTVERGVDPRGFALMAFGGAGGLHATAIAEELAMDTVLCPRASGVLAALGLVASPRRRDAQRSVLLRGETLTAEAMAGAARDLAAAAWTALGTGAAEMRIEHDVRYLGQGFELTVVGSDKGTPQELREAFERAHEERYGYRDTEQAVELVTVRVSATATRDELSLSAGAPSRPPVRSTRRAIMRGEPVEATVLQGELPPGSPLTGPAICELDEATLVVPPGWSGQVDAAGTVHLARGQA
jgi:N-methylhydantoinase A